MTNENTAPILPELPEPDSYDEGMIEFGKEYGNYSIDQMRAYALAALASKQMVDMDAVRDAWQPIETAPKDGYMLVHEDGAIRAMLRVGGEWKQIGYPAIISHPFGDSIVGKDAERILPAGYRLELRDGCCESPTHWMPLPSPPAPQPESKL